MHLHRVRDALLQQLSKPSAQRRLESVCASELALRKLRDPFEILRVLHDRNGCAKVRNDIVVALIQAAQLRRESEPVALLIVAFLPGLAAICRSARRHVRSALDDSLEQRVLESFIEAVHSFPLSTQARTATVGLVFATRRAVTRCLRRERVDHRCDPKPVDEHRGLASASIDPEGLFLCREVSPLISIDALHARLRSVGISRAAAQSLTEPASGIHGGARNLSPVHEVEARRAYWRDCRARHRLLSGPRIRNVREQLSSLREHLPLLQQEGWQ